jgi:hypothetical protein
VSVETEPGHGAAFRIALPLDPEAQVEELEEEPAQAGDMHSE